MATSSDVRAIMGLPASGGGTPTTSQTGEKQQTASSSLISKVKKVKRPDGITRELYALIGDNAPTLSLARPVMKERWKKSPRVVGWQQREFTNKARNDGLKLKHWVRKDQPEDAEYSFSKYNTSSTPYSYSLDEYLHHLRDDDWSREETDYLFDLLRQYDLRFLVVHDRWDFPNSNRTIEDLKERYYSVCRKLIRIRPAPDEATRVSLMNAYSFDRNRERTRKAYLKSLANRTPEQIAEEEFLYVESRRLEQNYSRIAREREELLRLVGGPGITGIPGLAGTSGNGSQGGRTDNANNARSASRSGSGRKDDDSGDLEKKIKHNAAFDSQHCITRHDGPNVAGSRSISAGPSAYLRSVRTPHMKTATQSKVEAALLELGISQRLVMPTKANMQKLESLVSALQMLVETKKQVDKSEYELGVLKKRKESANNANAEGASNDNNSTEQANRTKRSASVSSNQDNNKKARTS